MKAAQISKLLESMNLRYSLGPYGFLLPATVIYGYAIESDYRIERGSGIAGRGTWALTEVGSGERGKPCSRISELAKVLREWLAGPKPQFAGEWYARRHSTKFSSGHYIWVPRKWMGGLLRPATPPHRERHKEKK